MWFIPKGTYLSKFAESRNKYYPAMGFDGMLLTGKINYTEEFPKIKSLFLELENQTDILQISDSWVVPFQRFVKRNYYKGIY